MSAEREPHDPPAVFDALARHQVDYVTVGGLAVGYWGHPRATKDTDIVVPDVAPGNDERLSAALRELRAEPLALEAPGAVALGIAWNHEGDVQRWRTDGGVLDVLRSPDGAPPYEQLRDRSLEAELFGARTVIVSREDLIAMKLAAARLQDLLDLDALLDARNTESTRAELRADDRELLRVDAEPDELGAPVDPCERDVDQLRRTLAPTAGRGALERELTRRARELRTIREPRLAELVEQPLPEIPRSIERAAANVADAASKIEIAEQREFDLLRDQGRTPIRRRRERANLDARPGQATTEAEQLRDDAETGVEQLRDGMQTVQDWWQHNHKAAVDAIAGRRERYRREREQLTERVRDAPERPAGYASELIGERPSPPTEEWDRAARSIEAYAAQYSAAGQLRPPEVPRRAQRSAWERMSRAVHQLGIDPPGLDDRSRDTGLCPRARRPSSRGERRPLDGTGRTI